MRGDWADKDAAAGTSYNVVIVTLDAHAAGPVARAAPRLQRDFPGLTISVHSAAEWAENPQDGHPGPRQRRE